MLRSKMLINGELVDSLSGKIEIIYNPANQEPVAEVSVGSREDTHDWPWMLPGGHFLLGFRLIANG